MEFHDICPSDWADFCRFSDMSFITVLWVKSLFISPVLLKLRMKGGHIPLDFLACPWCKGQKGMILVLVGKRADSFQMGVLCLMSPI